MYGRLPDREYKKIKLPRPLLESEAFRAAPSITQLEGKELAAFLRQTYVDEKPVYTYPDIAYQSQIRTIVAKLEDLIKTQKLLDKEKLETLQKFPHHLFGILNEVYKTQTRHYPKNIKENLEIITYRINQPDFPRDRKQSLLANLIRPEELLKCSTGMSDHVEEGKNASANINSLPEWQAELRTGLVRAFAAEHAVRKGVAKESETHAGNVAMQTASQIGIDVKSDVATIKETFAVYAYMTREDKARIMSDVLTHYNLKKNVEFFCDKFIAEMGLDWQNYHQFKSKTKSLLNSLELQDMLTDFFDSREDDADYCRFSPTLFKQKFIEFCYRTEFQVKKDFWQEEKVFQHYRLIHAKPYNQMDLAWLQTINEDAKEEFIAQFDNLTAEEQLTYFEFCLVNFGVMDRFRFVKTPVFPDVIFNTREKRFRITRLLADKNKLLYGSYLFYQLFRENPADFVQLLVSFDFDVTEQILNLNGMEYALLQPGHPDYERFMMLIVKADGLDDTFVNAKAFSSWLLNKVTSARDLREAFIQSLPKDEFKSQHESKTGAILFSTLVKVAETNHKKLTPEFDPTFSEIYRIFQHAYFVSAGTWEETRHSEPLVQFYNVYQHIFGELDQKQKTLFRKALDGTINVFDDKVTLPDMFYFDRPYPIIWANRAFHQPVLDNFFLLTEQTVSDIILCNQIPSYDDVIAEMVLSEKIYKKSVEAMGWLARLDLFKKLHAKYPQMSAKVDILEIAMNCLSAHFAFKQFLMMLNPDISLYGSLKFAAENGIREHIQFLVTNGANINSYPSSPKDNPPLLCAVDEKNYLAAEMLIGFGADVNFANMNKFAPLHAAAQNNHLLSVEFLLKHGADATALAKKYPYEYTTDSKVQSRLLIAMAKKWERDSALPAHADFFKLTLEDSVENVADMLCSLKSVNSAKQLLEAMEVDYHLLIPQSPLHDLFLKLTDLMGSRNPELQTWLQEKVTFFAKQFQRLRLCQPVTSDTNTNIDYCTLLNEARKKDDTNQRVYKAIVQRHCPDQFRELQHEKKPDYAEVFAATNSDVLQKLSWSDRRDYYRAASGDIELADELNLIHLSETETALICTAHFNHHQRFLNILYERVLAYYAGEDTLTYKDSNTYYLCDWALLCHQKKEYERLWTQRLSAVGQHTVNDFYWFSGLLEIACRLDNVREIRNIFFHGGKPDYFSLFVMPFDYAVTRCSPETIQFFIDNGMNVNRHGKLANPCLISAIAAGHFSRVPALITAGVDVNAANEAGEKALHVAATLNALSVVEQLLKAGANPCALYKGKKPFESATDIQVKRILMLAELNQLQKSINHELPTAPNRVSLFKRYSKEERLAAIEFLKDARSSAVDLSSAKKSHPVLRTKPYSDFYRRIQALPKAAKEFKRYKR